MPNFFNLYIRMTLQYFAITSTVLLYALRVIMAILPTHGYIQPDEFFQFSEPLADRVFHTKTYLPWEFTVEQPLRSMFIPSIIAGIPFALIKKLCSDPSAYLLLVAPRLVMTVLSFIVDYSLFKVMKLHGLYAMEAVLPMFALASSHVALTYFTRTFTNTTETVIFALFLWVSTIIIRQENLRRTIFQSRFLDLLGIFLSLGFFNRPTFLAFALVPLLQVIWSTIKTDDSQNVVTVSFRVFRSFFSTSFLLVVFDTNFYTDLFVDFWNIASNDIVCNIIITPWNFMRYNSQSSNLEKHGIHPRYLHLLNLLFIGNVLVVPVYADLFRIIYSKIRRQPLSGIKLWRFFTIITPVALLSIFPHQEPRFLLPLILPICLAFRSKVTMGKGLKFREELVGGNHLTKKRFLMPWLAINFVLFLFYSYVHQSGVTQSLFYLHDEVHSKDFRANETSIIFAGIYLPPQHLLHLEKYNPVKIHDFSIADNFSVIHEQVFDILKDDTPATKTLYIVIPFCWEDKFLTVVNTVDNISGIVRYHSNLVKSFFPHFSSEVLSHCFSMFNTAFTTENAFRLNVWKINR